MNMCNHWLIYMTLTGAVPAVAQAADFTDTAQVLSATPIYRQVPESKQDCWTETVAPSTPQERSYGGAVLGGVAGAILGNQVGKGSGRDVATAVGAATGAIAGDRIDNSRKGTSPQQVQRCRQIDSYRQEVSGYNVVYRYNGRDIAATLPYHPGDTLTVGIGIVGAAR